MGGWGVPLALLSMAFSGANAIVQRNKQRAAERKANAEADARKGFAIVVSGEITTPPIIYGRQCVGGNRVFSVVKNDFRNTTSNADKIFSAGKLAYNNGDPYVYTGTKHEYLFLQQVLSAKDITSCYDILIDDAVRLRDAAVQREKGGIRIEIHNGAVEKACALLSLNCARKNAKFKGFSYASIAIKLDRDDPQFNGIPDIKFAVEGKAVRTVVAGVLSTVYAYSNNPAWVLLDYLLEECGIPVSEINLGSFEAGAAVCATTVLSNAVCGGMIWQPQDGVRSVLSRTLPLYEANLCIDTSKPYRANVASILESMGDARLVRPNEGLYTLSVKYPQTVGDIVVSDYIDDNRLKFGEKINVKFPQMDQRFNHAVVTYLNEDQDFKEDTVSWPPKNATVSYKGVGGSYYGQVSGWDSRPAGQMLNTYGVWQGITGTFTFNWHIRTREGGDFKVEFVADDSGYIKISNVILADGTDVVVDQTIQPSENWGDGTVWINGSLRILGTSNKIKTTTVTLAANTEYIITVEGKGATVGKCGVAGVITDSNGVQLWTTRDVAYTGFQEVSTSSAVYDAMLAEDNGVELETTLKPTGITDYYHALAAAEQAVRVSREAFSVRLKYTLGSVFPEPGDIIKLSSEAIQILGWANPFICVDKVEPSDGRTLDVEGSNYTLTQFAWNVDDETYEHTIYKRPEDEAIRPPYYVEYQASDTSTLANSSGKVVWTTVFDNRVQYFEVLMLKEGELNGDGSDKWNLLGTSLFNSFDLPKLSDIDNVYFGVRSCTNTGRRSTITRTTLMSVSGAVPPNPTNLIAAVFGDQKEAVALSWTNPTLRSDGSQYSNHSHSIVYRSRTNVFTDAVQVATVFGTTDYVDTPTEYGALHYWVANVSNDGVISTGRSNMATVTLDFWVQFTNTYQPPPPADLEATGMFSGNYLTWSTPTYVGGGGHANTLVYAAEVTETLPNPGIEDAIVVASVGFGSVYAHLAGASKTFKYWVKEMAVGGGISVASSPAIAMSIGTADLTDSISENELTAELRGEHTNLKNQWTVKQNNDGYLSGVGLASLAVDDEVESAFVILADRFSIVNPDTNAVTVTVAYGGGNCTVTYSSAHGVSTGDYITITKGPHKLFNGTKKVTKINDLVLRYTMDVPAVTSGTAKAGVAVVPFTVTDGRVHIDIAAIKDATITSAKIKEVKAESLLAGTIRAGMILETPVLNAGTGSFSGVVTVTNVEDVKSQLNIQNSITVILSNETHALPADNSGTVIDYSYSGTDISVYEGTDELVCDGIGAANGYYKINNMVGTNITPGALSIYGGRGRVGDHSAMSAELDTARVIFEIQGHTSGGNYFNVSKTQSLSKTRPGASNNYDVEIESTNGLYFRVNQPRTTTLKAHVYLNGVEVTDTLSEACFRWRRISYYPNEAGDLLWNTQHAAGYKQITVTIDDVNDLATFHCDILI